MSTGGRYRQRTAYPALLLGITALVASGVLVLGDRQTREAIAARKSEDLQASLAEVIPAQAYDNDLLEDSVGLAAQTGSEILVYRGRRGREITAVAWRQRAKGYAGPIDLLMGLDRSGQIQGVRVLSHSETPGLGDKIELSKSAWIRGFDGLSLAHPAPEHWAVQKDGGHFDQFTGATITPRAVVRAVKEGLLLFQRQRAALLDQPHTSAGPAGLATSGPPPLPHTQAQP